MRRNAHTTIVIAVLVSMLALTVSGCGSDSPSEAADTAPSSVSVTHELGTTEVPFSPTRVFVLDLPSLDTMDALGLGQYVAGVQEFRNVPDYLQRYYDGSILVLPSASHTVDEEALDAAYNAIDGDLIIGGSRQLDAYDYLSEIAPTLIMYSNGAYAGWGSTSDEEETVPPMMDVTRSEATKIASIWGLEPQVEEILAGYETRIAALDSAIGGSSGLILQANTQVNGMVPAATGSRLLADTSFVNLYDSAPEDLGGIEALTAAAREAARESEEGSEGSEGREGGGSRAQIPPEDAAKAMAIVNEWIAAQDPEIVFISDTYTSIEEAAAAGVEYPGVTELSAYKNGKLYFLSSITTTRGGLTFASRQIEELEKIFL